MNILRSRDIETREELGLLCNERGLLDVAVEIGTWEGDFAFAFLEHWKGLCMFCVDSFAPDALYPGYERDPEEERVRRRALAPKRWEEKRLKLGPPKVSGHVVELWQGSSEKEVRCFNDGEIDFVYLDADHTNPGFQQDLDLWWPKLRSGGIFAGHDFEELSPWKDVRSSVVPFAESKGILDLFFVFGDAHSWYFFKP